MILESVGNKNALKPVSGERKLVSRNRCFLELDSMCSWTPSGLGIEAAEDSGA